MLKDVTLGQFFPGNSILHKLDPRMKILLSVLYIVAIFCAQEASSLLLLAISALLLIFISRISLLTILRGIKPILFVLIFTSVILIFQTDTSGAAPIFRLEITALSWYPTIYLSGVIRAVLTAVRVVVLILGTSIFLTYAPSPIVLTDALEDLLRPLKYIRVPVHDFAMMMTIALRSIPTLIEETEKIMNAQKSRGADFSSGGLIKRVKALIPIIIPLFVSSFRRADELATAMECRLYRGGNGRTRMKKLKFKVKDVFGLIFALLILVGVILINVFLSQYGPAI
jgi:energy-coupling factor transport system permease protein